MEEIYFFNKGILDWETKQRQRNVQLIKWKEHAMYGLYPLGLLAGILLWVAMDYMDNKKENRKNRNAKHPAHAKTT